MHFCGAVKDSQDKRLLPGPCAGMLTGTGSEPRATQWKTDEVSRFTLRDPARWPPHPPTPSPPPKPGGEGG
jgi:hypothetical protein